MTSLDNVLFYDSIDIDIVKHLLGVFNLDLPVEPLLAHGLPVDEVHHLLSVLVHHINHTGSLLENKFKNVICMYI